MTRITSIILVFELAIGSLLDVRGRGYNYTCINLNCILHTIYAPNNLEKFVYYNNKQYYD